MEKTTTTTTTPKPTFSHPAAQRTANGAGGRETNQPASHAYSATISLVQYFGYRMYVYIAVIIRWFVYLLCIRSLCWMGSVCVDSRGLRWCDAFSGGGDAEINKPTVCSNVGHLFVHAVCRLLSNRQSSPYGWVHFTVAPPTPVLSLSLSVVLLFHLAHFARVPVSTTAVALKSHRAIYTINYARWHRRNVYGTISHMQSSCRRVRFFMCEFSESLALSPQLPP